VVVVEVVVDAVRFEALLTTTLVVVDAGVEMVPPFGVVALAVATLRVVPGISAATATPTAVVPSAATSASDPVTTRTRRAI
jgi:hypothetical protein